ncbi:mucin-binding lectin 1 [Coprinopsis sp. MPI-PUGE-AT-0042]|nr:mucin-binding lectin 1 [Coprinopsis sp. MPI-PUGE-AT-0042]
MAHIFATSMELCVITDGPGFLSLLSWQSRQSIRAHVGTIPTSNSGLTKFMVGFSHTFERFAIVWDGEGQAVYQIGKNLERFPVGRDWSCASTVHWGARELVSENVKEHLPAAVRRDRATTLFIIPDNL